MHFYSTKEHNTVEIGKIHLQGARQIILRICFYAKKHFLTIIRNVEYLNAPKKEPVVIK